MIFRYLHTLRYLKYSQIVMRVWQKFKQIKVDHSPAGKLRELSDRWVEPASRLQRMFSENSFTFLNVSHNIITIDDWNNTQWEKLWLYNLHYFDDLASVDAYQRIEWHRLLIQRWIDENPVGIGNGWEPYPSSLRIVNWIKWGMGGKRLGYELEDKWLNSLTIQVRFLSKSLETHILGNHLFANAKALLFSGLFFEGKEAEAWYQVGKTLVEREIPEQVLEDGGNFELSTMYHQIFLEDLLDIVNIHQAFSRTLPVGVEEHTSMMMQWLEWMSHPDGEISFFNDVALGVAPSAREIKNYLGRISGFSGLTKISTDDGFPANPKKNVHHVKKILIDLPASGYSRVEMGDAVALIDRAAVGPDYLPGHAHADTLSFELSLFGQRIVVNSGTSIYGTGKQRQLERGTSAHSTLMIDGENSSEVWGGFRVARRARVFCREQSEVDWGIRLSACHDGYKRLPGKPIHCREWLFEDGRITIHDKISGKGTHEVMSVIPIHPEIKVGDIEDNQVQLNVIGNEVILKVEGVGKLEIITDCYHPEFGLSIENIKLIFKSNIELPIALTTRIEW